MLPNKESLGLWSIAASAAVFLFGWIVHLNGLITAAICLILVVGAATITNGSYVLRRLAALVPTLILVTLFAFFLQTQRVSPQDVAIRVLGPGATEQAAADFIAANGLDAPFVSRVPRLDRRRRRR